jgi:hypothetical protein
MDLSLRRKKVKYNKYSDSEIGEKSVLLPSISRLDKN